MRLMNFYYRNLSPLALVSNRLEMVYVEVSLTTMFSLFSKFLGLEVINYNSTAVVRMR